MIKTDIIIIGAGPCGLFAVFEAGLLKMKCHLIDSLPLPGGQCSEIYPKKPIYDIPAYPEILAEDLVENLMKQISPFKPGFTLGERAERLEKKEDHFIVTTNKGTKHEAPVVVIAGGLGCFEPRKPHIQNIQDFEGKGIEYIIKDPDCYNGKKIIISGGGDSALDWAIYFSKTAQKVTLVHRRSSFRGHLDSVETVNKLAKNGKIDLITESEVFKLEGVNDLQKIFIKNKNNEFHSLKTDFWFPLFGLVPKLGPIKDWGLNLDKNAILVDNVDYSTNIEGVYAIGDVNTYPGKLKLILSGFHEGALMAQSAFKYVFPNQKSSFKYTTVLGGIKGF
jgi:thioredoxin reductase (NADPH)